MKPNKSESSKGAELTSAPQVITTPGAACYCAPMRHQLRNNSQAKWQQWSFLVEPAACSGKPLKAENCTWPTSEAGKKKKSMKLGEAKKADEEI